MTENNEKLFSEIKKLSLSAPERDLMKGNLKAFTVSHAGVSLWRRSWGIVSGHVAWSLSLVMLLLAGGTSSLAQSSVPGDLLYPVKENINRRLQSAITTNDDARIDVEARQVADALNDEERAFDNFVNDESKKNDDQVNEKDDNKAPTSPSPVTINSNLKDFRDEEVELDTLDKELRKEERAKLEL